MIDRDIVEEAIQRAMRDRTCRPDRIVEHVTNTVMWALTNPTPNELQAEPELEVHHVTVAEIEEMFAVNPDDFDVEVTVADANGKAWIIARTHWTWLGAYGVRHDPKHVRDEFKTPAMLIGPLTLLAPATTRIPSMTEVEIREQEQALAREELLRWRRNLLADGWDEGVATALNHAIRNDDRVTLRLQHLDGREWPNPHRAEDGTGDNWTLREFVRNGVCLSCGGAVMADGGHLDPRRHTDG